MTQNTRRRLRMGTAGIVVGIVCGMLAWNVAKVDGAAQDRHRKEKMESAIEETKTKGFDGVDFSYDVFGVPPGQDPQKTAEEAMAKDIADKPHVLTRQKTLLGER